MTEENSLGVSAVFACVKVISETMAQMDLETVEKVGKATVTNTKHPNYWLLHAQPSPNYNRFEWVQSMVAYALLWGNGYTRIKRDRFANAVELELLPAWLVTIKITERGKMYYEYTNKNGSTEVILQEDMIHLKNFGTDGYSGLSTIQTQRELLGNSMAKQEHEGSFYKNGAKASGILMFPGAMGPKEKKNVKESFEKTNEGTKNNGKTIILEDGVKYQQLTIPQGDAQFIESKQFDRTEVCGIFRVPPHKIGILNDANYSNIESQDRSFAKDTIVPWCERFQQEIDRKLFFEEERGRFRSQFNLDDLIKGDIKTRYEVYGMGIQNGVLQPAEAREAEGWPMKGTEQIQKFFMNGTMMPVETINAKPAEQPKEQPKAA